MASPGYGEAEWRVISDCSHFSLKKSLRMGTDHRMEAADAVPVRKNAIFIRAIGQLLPKSMIDVNQEIPL